MDDIISDLVETLIFTILSLAFLSLLLFTGIKATKINKYVRQESNYGDLSQISDGTSVYKDGYLYSREDVAAQIQNLDPSITIHFVGVAAGTVSPSDSFFTLTSKIPAGKYKCEYTTDGSGKAISVTYTKQ